MTRIDLKGFEVELLNLGCGKDKTGLGIDKLDFGQPIVWDLRNGIPLPDNSVKGFVTTHFLEHLNRDDLYPLFDEIRRVAVPDAEIYMAVPHKDTVESDFLGHLSYWDERRVEGIVMGLRGELELLRMWRDGIELRAKLKVKK